MSSLSGSCGSVASVNQLPQLRTDRGNTQHVDLARSVVREGGRDDDGLSLFLAAREREIARSPRGSIVRVVVVRVLHDVADPAFDMRDMPRVRPLELNPGQQNQLIEEFVV